LSFPQAKSVRESFRKDSGQAGMTGNLAVNVFIAEVIKIITVLSIPKKGAPVP